MTTSRANLILENPLGGRADFVAAVKDAVPRDAYYEWGGGLGDIINGAAASDVFHRLDKGERIVVVVLTHNPNSWEIFGFHPNADKLTILSLPISEIGKGYNRLDPGFRNRHGLPMVYRDQPIVLHYPFRAFPAPEDLGVIGELSKPFAVISATASLGPTDTRSFPPHITRACAAVLSSEGLVPVFVGRSYKLDNSDLRSHLHEEVLPSNVPGSISMIGRLTVPGNIELIRRAVLTVACDSAMGCAARSMHLPTFNLVGDQMWAACGGPTEGHASMIHKDFYYSSFKAYTDELFRSFVRRFR